MANLGPGELLVILAIALLVFGPKKLPEIGKGIGNALREFNKAKTDFMDSINSEAYRDDSDHGTSYSSAYGGSDAPSETMEYTGASTPAQETAHASQSVSPEALPYGSDFYAVEGDSQPSFRTAQPEHSAGTSAAHSNYRPAETAAAGSGEGKA
jgi:sec-independent protein translocase protein TatA